MSRCWVEFRQREVPNTWNPRLVGTQFKPRRKPRYFGSVPTIRCVSSKRGLKCFRRNSLNKRWYSLSPARTCRRMFPGRGPESARAILEVIGQRAQLNPQRSMNADDSRCREECVGSMLPGMRIPKEYEAHVLDHMRCNCSACMNFACQWRRALKDEFRQCVKDPLAPKRKPKRWMPVLERHRPCETAQSNSRPDKRSKCRRSPKVSWWYGNYSPSSDSDEYIMKPETLDGEPRHNDKFTDLPHSQHVAESNADGFEDVAMDGTTVPSRLTYRAPGDASECRNSAAGRSTRVESSFNRPKTTRRNRLIQGILDGEDAPAVSELDDLDNQHTRRLTDTASPTKYTNLPDENWDTDNTYERKDESQHLIDDRKKYLSEAEKYSTFKSRDLFSDKTANKYSPYGHNLHSNRSTYRGTAHNNKVHNNDPETRGNQYSSQFSEQYDKHHGRGQHNVYPSEDLFGRLSYPDRQISKYTHKNAGKTPEHYQQCNKSHSGRYLLDVIPTRHLSLSGAGTHPDENWDSCNNRRHSHQARQHSSYTDQKYLHPHRYRPPHHRHSSSHLHDDNIWNYSHHASQSPSDMPRQLAKNKGDYPDYTEVSPEILSNKNIYNRSVDGSIRRIHKSPEKQMRRKINFHEHNKESNLDNSEESATSVKSRTPSRLCKRWTSLSPSKFDLCPFRSKFISARELNDNENKSITESPSNVYNEREYIRRRDKREDCERNYLSSSASRRKQRCLNTDRAPLPARSSQENDNNVYKRQRTFSPSPLDSDRLKTPGRSRRSRSRSRKTEDIEAKVSKNARQELDITQSNSAFSANSPIKHTQTFGPSERVLREHRPKSRPEWFNKHMSLMTECSQEQQDNAKSRMTRIVQKTNALGRSTDHMKLDFNQLHERLDRVKDLQQSYLQRAEDAIHRMKDRNRACFSSQLAQDNSKNSRESHLRASNSSYKDAASGHTTRRRHAEDANRRGTRTKQSRSSSAERGRLYIGREKCNVERHSQARVTHSEDCSDIGLSDAFPAKEIITDSDSEQDSQTEDGDDSWFVDDKRRIIARKNSSATKYRRKKN